MTFSVDWIFYLEREAKKRVELCNALIDVFAKCGDVDEASKLFRNVN